SPIPASVSASRKISLASDRMVWPSDISPLWLASESLCSPSPEWPDADQAGGLQKSGPPLAPAPTLWDRALPQTPGAASPAGCTGPALHSQTAWVSRRLPGTRKYTHGLRPQLASPMRSVPQLAGQDRRRAVRWWLQRKIRRRGWEDAFSSRASRALCARRLLRPAHCRVHLRSARRHEN